MKTVGERYSYWMLKVADLEVKLKLAEHTMCPKCYEEYKKNQPILIEAPERA